jgi:hypothetical protein
MNTTLQTRENETQTQGRSIARGSASWSSKIFGFVGTLILCLAILEGVFYLARVGESDHLMPDSYLGFKPIAGKRVTQRKEGFSSLTLNSLGMQNDEVALAKPVGTLRVAVFGDSFVEALQVPRQDNYCSLLAKKLQGQLQRPVQVLNFGVSNYSVAQDLLRYETLARQFHPDLVILAYRVGETEKVLPNATQGLAFIRPVFFPDSNGKMVYSDAVIKEYARSKEYKRLQATHWLRCYSRIWGVLGQLNASWISFWQAGSSRKTAAGPAVQALISTDRNREEFAKCYWYMVDGVLKKFADDVRADGARMLILRTPFKMEGRNDTVKNPSETRLLRNTADNINVSFFDIDSELAREGVDNHTREYFLEFGHFSRALHKQVAEKLGTFIGHQGLLVNSAAGNTGLQSGE